MYAILYKSNLPYWNELPKDLDMEDPLFIGEDDITLTRELIESVLKATNSEQGDLLLLADNNGKPIMLSRVGLSFIYSVPKEVTNTFIDLYLQEYEVIENEEQCQQTP